MKRAKFGGTSASPIMRRLALFRRNADGATAVEFAIVGAPFFGLLLFVLQVGLYFFSLQSLEYATRLAGREIMTGGVSSSVTTASQFKNTMICPKVFWAISCNDLVVNAYVVAKASSSKSGTGVYAFIDTTSKALNPPQTDPAKQSFCLGGPGDYVYVDVAYNYPNFTMKLLSSVASTTMAMRSGTMVYNEPKSASRSC